MFRICIWMNMPSHYQSAFFRALDARADVDLRVVYLHWAEPERIKEGWSENRKRLPNETCVDGKADVAGMEAVVPDWRQRIHVLGMHFFPDLVDCFCREGVEWCHWSEVPGIRLAEALGYRMALYRFLHPVTLLSKRRDGRFIRHHALGAFGQGKLACDAFYRMGVPRARCAHLYYMPEALEPAEPSEAIGQFARGRKVLLSVGALGHRKGIDILLKAFSRLDREDWCLVLCGLDRSEGAYPALAVKLGLQDRVLFTGPQSSDHISEIYAAADVFVLPSRFDGWGVVLNEAASLGMPLVATDLCGASHHLIEHGINGYRVRAGSVCSLADALRHYMDEPSLVRKHGDSSRKIFEAQFTPGSNASRMVDALKRWKSV